MTRRRVRSPLPQAGERVPHLPDGAEQDPAVREAFANRGTPLAGDRNLLSNVVARRAGVDLPDSRGATEVEVIRSGKEKMRQRGKIMTSVTEEADKKQLITAMQEQMVSVAEMVTNEEIDPQDVLSAIRKLKKKEAESRVTTVRNLVEEGIGDSGPLPIDDIVQDAKEHQNDFIQKFTIFVGVEGDPTANCPTFVIRFIRPSTRGYADSYDFTGRNKDPQRDGKGYTVAEKKSVRIDQTISDIEGLLKWILARWER